MFGSVADPHNVDADPDPAFHFDADLDQDPTLQFDDPDPITHIFPDMDHPMLQNDPLRLPPFHFDADPASQNNPYPCGSGSATLPKCTTIQD
jgi:hypothetical protein